MYFETSAKEGTNVKTLFNELAKKLIGVDHDEEEENFKRGVQLRDVREDPDAQVATGQDPKEKCNC